MDVHAINDFSELWKHDFWGQDITLADSHKSFRPITVLSYRLNYMVHGLSAAGFHMGNIACYAVAAVLFYKVSSQWVVAKTNARIAALLFVFHPVHVEPVASVVGRSDLLCSVFYLFAMWTYRRMHKVDIMSSSAALRVTKMLVYFGKCVLFIVLAAQNQNTGPENSFMYAVFPVDTP